MNRDLLELRIAQGEVMGAAVEAMVEVLLAADDRDSSVQPLDLRAVMWRAVASGAGSEPPVRLKDLRVERKGPDCYYTLVVENALGRRLALKNEHFFRCQVTVETHTETGALLQRLAKVASVANVKGNSLDGVQVSPGNRAEGVVAFFVGMPLAGPPVRDQGGRRMEVRTMNMVALLFTDGEVCAAVRDTTF